VPHDIADWFATATADMSRPMLEAVGLEGYCDETLTRSQVGRVLGLSFWEEGRSSWNATPV
jgi:hypothetical protein